MPFGTGQIEQLEAKLAEDRIHTRRKQGIELRYLEDGFTPRRKARVTVETILALTVRTASGCLEYQGARDKDGYGRVFYRGRQRPAHSVVCEWRHGPLAAGEIACHSCDNPPCVEPEHVFPGTHTTNRRDAIKKGRAHAPVCPPELKARGERIAHAVLTAVQVAAIKRRLADREAQRTLAAEYRVHPATINLIATGRNWKDVEADDAL